MAHEQNPINAATNRVKEKIRIGRDASRRRKPLPKAGTEGIRNLRRQPRTQMEAFFRDNDVRPSDFV